MTRIRQRLADLLRLAAHRLAPLDLPMTRDQLAAQITAMHPDDEDTVRYDKAADRWHWARPCQHGMGDDSAYPYADQQCMVTGWVVTPCTDGALHLYQEPCDTPMPGDRFQAITEHLLWWEQWEASDGRATEDCRLISQDDQHAVSST